MVPLTPAQQTLVTDNIGIAIAVLKRMNVHAQGWEEARDEAYIALCLAAQTYDPSKGTAFSGWAWRKIKWAVADWMKRENQGRRLYESTLNSVVPRVEYEIPDDTTPADEAAYDAQVSAAVREALATAPRRVRDVANLAIRGTTKEQTARRLNISTTSVVRRKADARTILGPLREILAKGDESN
jgi:RNA polymerase sigma factor (sigma-70 family)